MLLSILCGLFTPNSLTLSPAELQMDTILGRFIQFTERGKVLRAKALTQAADQHYGPKRLEDQQRKSEIEDKQSPEKVLLFFSFHNNYSLLSPTLD